MMLRMLAQSFQYEWLLFARRKADWIPVLLLFGLTVVLFGFSLSNHREILAEVGPTIIWVSILFSMLSLSELTLRKDVQEGWITQLRLSAQPLWVYILAKAIAFWSLLTLSFILMLPIILSWLYLDLNMVGGMLIIYTIATPALILIMMLGSALTVGLPQPGLLLGLLLLPLYVPILILGQSALQGIQNEQWPRFESALLGALSLVCIICLPYLIDVTLQHTSEESC